jgi:uncharacterized protein (TIGR03435 family)
MTLKFLIDFAWNLNSNDKEVIVGAPAWLDSDHYDIQAKAAAEDLGEADSGNPQIEFEELRLMLQALLIDRFSIQAHMESRPVDALRHIALFRKLFRPGFCTSPEPFPPSRV